MADWETQHLGDVAQLKMGQSPPGPLVTDLNRGLPFLQGNAEFGVRCPRAILQCDEAPRRSAPGDSLISVRAPVGAINRADREYGIGRGLAAVAFDMVDPDFGHHALVEWSRDLRRVSQGTTFSAIGRRELAALQLPVPPLEEQRRIAEILDTINEAIQATEHLIAKHERVRARLATDLLTGPSAGGPPDEQKPQGAGRLSAPSSTSGSLASDEVLLEDCGRWLSGGTPDTGNPAYWGGEIPWITASSLRGRYLSKSLRRLTPAGAKAGSRIVPRQTILFVVRGMSLKKEFRVGMAVRPVAFGQDCKALVPADGVDSKYLLFALEAAENRVLRMVDEASHGTGRLQMSLLGRLRVWLPPLEHQRRITAILDTIDEAVHSDEKHLHKLRELRAGLSVDLLSGRVRTVAA